MKEYKYIRCSELENYSGWDIVQIIPRGNNDYDMVVISRIKTIF